MYSSSSCGGSRRGYVQYEMDVSCPNCGRNGDIKISRSRDNPSRIFYKCSQCGKFIKWAIPVQERDIVAYEHGANKMVLEQLI